MTRHTSPRDRALDGLRGVAALSVFGFHAWLYTLPVVRASARSSVTDFALHELRLGLVLFFVLSGFLLWQPWVRAASGSGEPPRPGAFLLRRAARIMRTTPRWRARCCCSGGWPVLSACDCLMVSCWRCSACSRRTIRSAR